jgi:hypothetical protein
MVSVQSSITLRKSYASLGLGKIREQADKSKESFLHVFSTTLIAQVGNIQLRGQVGRCIPLSFGKAGF